MQPTPNANAPRTISSGQTFLMKAIFPTLWISVFGLGTLSVLFGLFDDSTDAALPRSTGWMFLLAWLLGSAFIYQMCIRLKRVRMDSEALFISNYREEIRVSFHDISAISEWRWTNPRHVTIELCRDTAFGNKIVFMPKALWWNLPWKSHPVVAELRDAARSAGALAVLQVEARDASASGSDTRSVWARRIKIGLGVATAAGAFIALVLAIVEGSIKSSEVYQLSLTKAQTAGPVAEYIGQPFRQGWLVSGSLSEAVGGTGEAVLSIPISGPKGSGRLHVEARRQAGSWSFRALQLEVDGRESEFDLLVP